MTKVPQVLVIDPDRESTADIQKLLVAAGFSLVGQSGYGVEGFTLAFQLHPDVVLARVDEPSARPLQTLSKLNDALPDLPLVAFSQTISSRLMRQCMISGVDDVLEAPLQSQDLADSLSRAMDRKERANLRRRGALEAPVPQGTIVTVFGAKGGI
ncbi:MAG: hypothetical protein ACE5D3_00955, partial [Candidatus Binatia bacterium]